MAVLAVEDIHPAKMARSEIGDRLHRLMQLEDIPVEDVQRTSEPLAVPLQRRTE